MRTRLSEICYFLFFLLLFTTRVLGLMEGSLLYSLTLVIGGAFFLLSYLLVPKTRLMLLCDAGLVALAGVGYVFSGEKGLLLFFAMMLGVRATTPDRLFIVSLLTAGIAYLAMIFLGAMGLISEAQNILYQLPVLGYITRRSLGPLQVNGMMLPYLVFMMMVLWLCRSKRRRQTRVISALLLAGLCYLFLFCFAKTTLLVGILLLVLNEICRFHCRFGKPSLFVSHGFYSLCVLLGVFCPILYDDTIVHDHFMSWFHRLSIGHYFWVNNRIPFFGQRLNDPDPESVIYPLIHQSQLMLLLQYGIVLFVLINFLYHLTIQYLLRKRSGVGLAITLSYAALGVLEPMLFNLSFKNISFLFVGIAYTELLERMQEKLYRRRSVSGEAPGITDVEQGMSVRSFLPDREIILRSTLFTKTGERPRSWHMEDGGWKRISLIAVLVGVVLAVIAGLSGNSALTGVIAVVGVPGAPDTVEDIPATVFAFDRLRFVCSAFLWGSLLSGGLVGVFTNP